MGLGWKQSCSSKAWCNKMVIIWLVLQSRLSVCSIAVCDVQEVCCVEFHPVHQILASGSRDFSIKFYEYSKPSVKKAYKSIQVVSTLTCIAYHHSLLRFAWGIAEAKCVLGMAVCVSVCLPVPRCIPTLLHGPGRNLGEWYGCPLVVHCLADFQSVRRFHYYDNMVSNAKCQRVLVLALCLVVIIDVVVAQKMTQI